MNDLTWVREIKTVDAGLSHSDVLRGEFEAQVNKLLAEGWKIIDVLQERRHFEQRGEATVTFTHYLLGR